MVTQLYPQLYDLLNEKCKEVPKEVEEKVKILNNIVTSDDYEVEVLLQDLDFIIKLMKKYLSKDKF